MTLLTTDGQTKIEGALLAYCLKDRLIKVARLNFDSMADVMLYRTSRLKPILEALSWAYYL